MSLYVDTDTLKATLEIAGTTRYDDDLDQAISAASTAIDKLLGRTFGKSSSDETRLYATSGLASPVRIDDLAAYTSLTADRDDDGAFEETWTRDTDFRLLPLNAALDDQPWTHIEILRAGNYTLPAAGILKLTGRFGFPAPPATIVEAAGLIATQLFKRKRDAPFGVQAITVGDATIAAQIARRDPHIALLLELDNRRSLFV